jgi:hypothetical protein
VHNVPHPLHHGSCAGAWDRHSDRPVVNDHSDWDSADVCHFIFNAVYDLGEGVNNKRGQEGQAAREDREGSHDQARGHMIRQVLCERLTCQY